MVSLYCYLCCCGQGHQEETPGPEPGEAKSPETTEQNAEEAHRARSAPRGALKGEIRGNQALR